MLLQSALELLQVDLDGAFELLIQVMAYALLANGPRQASVPAMHPELLLFNLFQCLATVQCVPVYASVHRPST